MVSKQPARARTVVLHSAIVRSTAGFKPRKSGLCATLTQQSAL